MKFTKRTTAPSKDDKYYIHYSKGGYNTCIVIDKSTGSVLANCVGYAQGRLREILNDKEVWSKVGNLACNPDKWIATAEKNGFKTGTTPKLGAVAVWSGHVAVVEEIKANGDIVCSNSAYKSTYFYMTTHTKVSGYGKDGHTFLEFIYCGIEFDVEPDTDTHTVSASAGKAVTLNSTPVYTTATKQANYAKKTGVFYLWSNEVINGRVKITTKKEYVGVAGKVTCWVALSGVGCSEPAVEVKKVPKVGDTVQLRAGAKYWDGKQPASFVYTRKTQKVKSISGKRAVITYMGITVGAVNIDDLTVI